MSFRKISTFALSVFVAALLAPASQADTHWKETCEEGLDPVLKPLLCGSAPSMVDECRAEWGRAPARSTCTSGMNDNTYARGKCKLSKTCSYKWWMGSDGWETRSRGNVLYVLPNEVASLCANSKGYMSVGGC